MGIATMTAGLNPVTVNLSASAAAVGGGFVGQTAGGTPVTWRDSTLTATVGNTTAKGGNECGRVITTVSASSNTTIDLRSIADLLGSTVVLARVKWVSFRNLAAADDSVHVTTTPSTSLTVGSSGANDWASQGSPASFGPGSTWSFTLRAGGRIVFDAGPDDANGGAVDATHHLIKFTNNDASNTAYVETCFGGGDS